MKLLADRIFSYMIMKIFIICINKILMIMKLNLKVKLKKNLILEKIIIFLDI